MVTKGEEVEGYIGSLRLPDTDYVSKIHLLHWQLGSLPLVPLGKPVSGPYIYASPVALVVKNLPASAGDIRDAGLIPGLGRSPGGGHSNPLRYSCLENPMDRGSWWATVHGVARELDMTEHTLNTHTSTHTHWNHFVVHLERTQDCKSAILFFKKVGA